jgi:putative transposase
LEKAVGRIARVVVPCVPHHIIQRGNRRQNVFFCEDDKWYYLKLLKKHGLESGIEYWAYCLMDNHVHLIAVPKYTNSFAVGFGEVNRKYTVRINLREDWRGYLWQGRFLSYPLDGCYLLAAIRYVELNPIRAGVVGKIEDYPWSSARAHILGIPDDLIEKDPLKYEIKDWRSFLSIMPAESEMHQIKKHMQTGRPLGDDSFLSKLENITGRILKPKKRGKRPKG